MMNQEWVRNILNAGDEETIIKAVKKAESRTMGEIVPMIVRRSCSVGHVPWLLAAIGLILFLAFEVVLFWFSLPEVYQYLNVVVLALQLFLNPILAKKLCVQRCLTPELDQDFQTWERAELEFHRLGIDGTGGQTGILIFVSLMEHEVVVLADKAIADRLPKTTWKELIDNLTKEIRQGRAASGLVAAIDHCGEILATHFPANGKNPDELPNRLIIRE